MEIMKIVVDVVPKDCSECIFSRLGSCFIQESLELDPCECILEGEKSGNMNVPKVKIEIDYRDYEVMLETFEFYKRYVRPGIYKDNLEKIYEELKQYEDVDKSGF